MSSIIKTYFEGDPNIGLLGFATDGYSLVGVNPKKKFNIMKVPVHRVSALSTGLTGIFISGNSSGIVAPWIMDREEVCELKKIRQTLVLQTDYTALGNLVLMNDNGIVLSTLLRKHKKEMEAFFGLPCAVSKIARLIVTGSAAFATNKGCLAHPKITSEEKSLLETTLGVPVDIGTVSFGSPFVGAGIVANSFGIMVSEGTSGPELGRIVEALGFI